MKLLNFFSALCAAVLLIACSDKHPTATAANGSAAGGLIDACALLAKADMAALVGAEFTAKSNTILTYNNDNYEKSGDCKITTEGGKNGVYFTVFVWKDESGATGSYNYGQDTANSGKIMAGIKTVAVAGIGDSAYTYNYAYGPGFASKNVTLVARSGKKIVSISQENSADDNAKQIEQAKIVASKLIGNL